METPATGTSTLFAASFTSSSNVATAGVCLEDKTFPKSNSLLTGIDQTLADPDVFAGKIKAAVDTRLDPDFVVVAGWKPSSPVAIFRSAGAGRAVCRGRGRRHLHSLHPSLPDQVLAFRACVGRPCASRDRADHLLWHSDERVPRARLSLVLWANHLLRSSLSAMQRTAAVLHGDESAQAVEEAIAPVAEVFRLQGVDELEEARHRYTPGSGPAGRSFSRPPAAGRWPS